MFFDKTMIFLIPAMLIAAWAQMKIKSSFNTYSQVTSRNGYSGAHVARILLDSYGLFHIPVEITEGTLSDHYDPSKKVMRLSREVFYGTSVASIGVAAHETGHAIQHKENYTPLVLRNAIVPVANIGSSASWLLFLAGMILGIRPLVSLGILFFTAVVAFQLITLPVEFDASNRALRILESKGILYTEELQGAKKVLNAAAMTYVAATLMAISQLIRLLALSNRRED